MEWNAQDPPRMVVSASREGLLVKQEHRREIGAAIIVSKTPYRVSLFGGGTDYKNWYLQHGGAVCGFTIDKFCSITLRVLPPFFEHKYRIVYSQIELPNCIADIQHKSVRAVLAAYPPGDGVEIHHFGDLPARSGMGSSSAFTVGMINAATGGGMNPYYLASEAIRIEQNVLHENVGCQDQIFAAYGGANLIEFCTDGKWKVTPLTVRPDLQEHLLLFFTGLSRTASVIAEQQIAEMEKHIYTYDIIRGMALMGAKMIVGTGPIAHIGEMLNATWRMKKELAGNISNPMIDGAYQAAKDAGAIGGKLLGAGGGGMLLLFAAPEHHAKIRERLKSLVEVQFKIGSAGSTVTEQ